MEYIIALGSNIGDRLGYLLESIKYISSEMGKIEAKSKVYETLPWSPPGASIGGQSLYLNGVIVVKSNFSPKESMLFLLNIERRLGRTRNDLMAGYGPRTIDLDIIAAENSIVDLPEVCLPHPRMHLRDFVLKPLLDVKPKWVHPILEKTARELMLELNSTLEGSYKENLN